MNDKLKNISMFIIEKGINLIASRFLDDIPENHIKDYCETVYNGFIEEKTEDIIALFCNKSKKDHNLEEELTQAFSYINGDIALYESFSAGPSDEAYEKGELVRYYQTAIIMGVVTYTGHKYTIAINSLNVYPDNIDLVGIQEIYIREYDRD